MTYKDLSGLFLKGGGPFHQAFTVCMTTDAREHFNLRIYLNLFSEQLHLRRAVHQGPSRCSHRLIAHKKHGTFFSPQIVFQVMLYTSRITHAAGGYDHLTTFIGVDGTGFLSGNRKLKSRKCDGILSFLHQFHGFLIKAFAKMFTENAGGLHCQRAVNYHGKIPMPLYHLVLFDFPDKIKHLLGPAHRKGRDHHITAPVKGPLNHLSQRGFIIPRHLVLPVSVSGLHHHIIRISQICGIFYQRLVQVPDISRKNNLSFLPVFCKPEFYAGRTQQMPCIDEPDLNPIRNRQNLFIRTAHQQADSPLCIIHVIKRLDLLFSGSLSFPVSPLCLRHLNMRAVTKHDITQIRRSIGGINTSPKSPGIQQR